MLNMAMAANSMSADVNMPEVRVNLSTDDDSDRSNSGALELKDV